VSGALGTTIRAARRADAAGIARLLDQLGYPQAGLTATADRVESWSQDPARAAFVAEADDQLLGVIAVLVCPFFERTATWCRIVALVVAATARGRGVGSALVAAAEAFAETQGCLRLEVTSAVGRRDAHAFYRARGYVDQGGVSLRFLRDLATGQ